MCSINGFNSSDGQKIRDMVSATSHRGPDAQGIEVLQGMSLGHARLKIIDLSDAASQPMWNHDRTLCIVFNGEIYNFRELREKLRSRYRFKTKSDTEVLLALYEEKGPEGFGELNGIFAFAVWDARKKELVLVRDQGGVKPLYFSWKDRQLVFSSEAKAIVGFHGSARLNRDVLPVYLSLGFVPGQDTLFQGIRRLEPGTYAVLSDGKLRFEKYWHPDRKPFAGSYDDAKKVLRRHAENAVRRQMVSDRSIGIFLSGGIDSTTVATLAARQSEESINTYTTRFDFHRDPKFNADADLAARTAKRLGAKHHEQFATARQMIDGIERVGWHLDEPNGNSSAGAVALLAQKASKDVAVLLSGDGPDELFGGYERYEKSRMLSWARRVPEPVRRLAASLPGIPDKHARKLAIASDSAHYVSFWGAKEVRETRRHVQSFFEREFFLERKRRDFENLMMEVDRCAWLMDDCLAKLDRLLAASGVEGRVPLLDKELIEFSMTIPSSWKLKRPWKGLQQGKRIWIDALADLLPDEIRNKEKTGWFAPMAKWLRDPYVYKIVRARLGALPPSVFDPVRAVGYLDSHRDGGYHLQMIWTLLSLQVWLERFKVEV